MGKKRILTVFLALALVGAMVPAMTGLAAEPLSKPRFDKYLAESEAGFRAIKADLAQMNITDRGLANKISHLVPGLEQRFEKAGQVSAQERSKTWRELKYLMRDLRKDFLQAKIQAAKGRGEEDQAKDLEEQRQTLIDRINYDYRMGGRLKTYRGQIGILKNEAAGKRNNPTAEWGQVMASFEAAQTAAESEYENLLEVSETEWVSARQGLDKAMAKLDGAYKKAKAEFKKF